MLSRASFLVLLHLEDHSRGVRVPVQRSMEPAVYSSQHLAIDAFDDSTGTATLVVVNWIGTLGESGWE